MDLKRKVLSIEDKIKIINAIESEKIASQSFQRRLFRIIRVKEGCHTTYISKTRLKHLNTPYEVFYPINTHIHKKLRKSHL